MKIILSFIALLASTSTQAQQTWVPAAPEDMHFPSIEEQRQRTWTAGKEVPHAEAQGPTGPSECIKVIATGAIVCGAAAAKIKSGIKD